ncbi:hypothetical protein WR25_27149 [Diploscapter pachys]|uniref:3'(2'),5'-bisphosphate nucleotidase 1 n=1 Tax=Diploscapter pachys TaxID=2018661 RepID=A0A2A2LW85_9BILA|nr:hypothetical protein WR25_27149 [Diploscapter pachys]
MSSNGAEKSNKDQLGPGKLEEMWNRAATITKIVASSVKISETAGGIIKSILSSGDLKIVYKDGEVGKRTDPQTEADRSAQYCIVNSLQSRFKNLQIIGEEDNTSVSPHIETGYLSDVLKLDERCAESLRNIKEEELVVWVDPLDGTSEVTQAVKNNNTALLQQVTILIGIAHKGRPIAGVIHQPYYKENGRTIWAIQGCGVHGIKPAEAQQQKIVVTTRSHLSDTVVEALTALKEKGLADSVEKVGGAGFKVLKLLEGCSAYVFASAGCKKWDTCAVDAVLAAAGGTLTDISGRSLLYHADVQKNNTGGVLATAPWIKHQDYVSSIPENLKNQLPEFNPKR